MRIKFVILALFFILFSDGLHGQTLIQESLFTDSYELTSKKESKLEVSIDNISFLRNVETDGDIRKGYTLPGFRMNPRIVYNPAPIVRLEAGLSLLKFWGADKYPNYAYRDIAEWKADGYQFGFHLLPFFRAQVQPIPQLNIVFGNIYGGSNHNLIKPLYNKELNLTADPELGAQILYNSRVAHLDTWINWESFTFKNDTHNEAATFGVSACLHLTNPQSFFYFGIPVQALWVHRGGEIDVVRGNVTTLANGSTGLQFGFNFNHPVFKSLGVNVMGIGYKDFSPEEISLPFHQGWAFYSCLDARIWNTYLNLAFWRSGNLLSIFGNPVFGNVSNTIDGRTFPRTMVLNPELKYEQELGRGFYLGADWECYYNPKLIAYRNSIYVEKISKSFAWSAGLYLRINPSIVLK
jgi:hypothetical protein